MKARIISIDVFSLRAPLDRAFHWSSGTAVVRYAVLVSISTENGLTGWGEALAPETAGVIRNALIPELENSDALNLRELMGRLHAAAVRSGAAPAIAAESVGAVEVALWDIVSRAADRPLWSLFAERACTHVHAYASSIYYGKEDDCAPAVEATRWMERGFYGVKMKIGRTALEQDIARVASVRRAIGNETPLMVDANQICDLNSAIELAGGLSPFNILWLEEPLPSHDVAGHRALKCSVRLPIATGENLHSVEEFRPFIEESLTDFVQPNVARVGGFSAALDVARMALQAGLRVAVHHWGTPVGLAASLHLAFSLDSAATPPSVEVDLSPNPLRSIAACDHLQPRNGIALPPQDAGLGIVPRPEALAQYYVAAA